MTQYHTYSITFQVKQQMMNFQLKRLRKKNKDYKFTFSHLADALIQSELFKRVIVKRQ